MHWLNKFADKVKKLNYRLAVVGMFLLVPMMLLTSVDVVARAVFNQPTTGVYELSSYLLAGFVLLGLAYTYQTGGHVRIDLLVSRLPPGWSALCNIVTTLLSLFIVAILIWQGWQLGIAETTVSEQLRIPEAPVRMLVPFGGVLLWLAMFAELLTTISQALKRQTP